ncbi:MAG: tRNA lysidine(34) synthetase TilS [Burkholderiaceae bacterium]|nr:tRNA lysidine(34) synthetase TilS [Burkholderiaceae bacterium]
MSDSFELAIASFQPLLPMAVAYSGGADSAALLLACAQQWPGQVSAIHVHHGLQTAADDFVAQCESFCAHIGVPLHVLHVDARHAVGESPEAAARIARYAAFKTLAGDNIAYDAIKSIAIGQHLDDQVETLLLALSRGAGLPGLSAMPAQWVRDGITYYRPLLGVRAADIRTWLAAPAQLGLLKGLKSAPFIEDPTNQDEQFTRNRIRARLLPALDAAFPQFRETFARSAAHAAQAQELLEEVAAQDLTHVGQPPAIKALQQLSPARQVNVLRFWLKSAYKVSPSTVQMDELLSQIKACTTRGHQIHLKVGSGFVHRHGPQIDWQPA